MRGLIGSVLCLVSTAAAATDPPANPVETRLGGDSFAAGPSVTLREPVGGDFFAAGGNVEVRAPVAGDAVLAGGKVWIDQPVGQSVYVAGGQVTLLGKVGRNLRSLGGELMLGPGAEVAGNVSVAGGQLTLRGTVRGHLQIGGGRVVVDGPVGGDVVAQAGTLELGPNARVAGRLRWRSGNELVQDPGAVVQGGVERMPLPSVAVRGGGARPDRDGHGWGEEGRGAGLGRVAAAVFGVMWTAGLALLAAALLAALPGFYEGLALTLRTRPGASLLLGFVLLVCVPVAGVLLLVTVVGIPLALLALLLYALLLPLAYVSAAIGLGDWALRRLRTGSPATLGGRIAAAALALVALTLLGALPWVGALVGLLVLLAGLGALALHVHARWRGVASAAGA